MPRPINWRTLSSDDAEHEWLDLNEWVNWLRHEFALPAQIVPPMWHRHRELRELSALYTRWLGCYDPEQDAAGPISFMTDFAAARTRLREWVQIAGTRLDRDRPPGKPSGPAKTPSRQVRRPPSQTATRTSWTSSSKTSPGAEAEAAFCGTSRCRSELTVNRNKWGGLLRARSHSWSCAYFAEGISMSSFSRSSSGSTRISRPTR